MQLRQTVLETAVPCTTIAEPAGHVSHGPHTVLLNVEHAVVAQYPAEQLVQPAC